MRLNEQHLNEGLTIVLPGIDGRALHNENICRALAALNVPTAIELHDWTFPVGPIFNQCAVGRNRDVSAMLAAYVVDYRRQHPQRPVYLIGHSGGTAIAVWAAEAMPPGEELDGVVLLGSSLSPGYDLSRALAGTKQLITYYSTSDAVLLGAGCTVIGTMDRQFTEAAGKVGFSMTHPRLTQIPYDSSMARAGHDGSHFSYCGTGFVTAYVGPLIRSDFHDGGPVIATAPPPAEASGAAAGTVTPIPTSETLLVKQPEPSPEIPLTRQVLAPLMDAPPFLSARPPATVATVR
jgi:pimeloyl-ACP methyl ester carboxylesterase